MSPDAEDEMNQADSAHRCEQMWKWANLENRGGFEEKILHENDTGMWYIPTGEGYSAIEIAFCPWCGKELPQSIHAVEERCVRCKKRHIADTSTNTTLASVCECVHNMREPSTCGCDKCWEEQKENANEMVCMCCGERPSPVRGTDKVVCKNCVSWLLCDTKILCDTHREKMPKHMCGGKHIPYLNGIAWR